MEVDGVHTLAGITSYRMSTIKVKLKCKRICPPNVYPSPDNTLLLTKNAEHILSSELKNPC